jgi:Mor family transcriptional regulator
MEFLVELLYANRSLQPKKWEKRERNAEIYQRYLAGEDSVVLAQAYGVSDRRIRTIIAHERKRESERDISKTQESMKPGQHMP